MSTHDIDLILENYVRGYKILLVVRKAFYICFLMHWTRGIWLQEKIDQNYNSYFVVIMWGHLIMGEQVKERLGSLTTMAINHHKACTFRISSKNQCSWSLKKFNVQMSLHDKRYRSEEISPALVRSPFIYTREAQIYASFTNVCKLLCFWFMLFVLL